MKKTLPVILLFNLLFISGIFAQDFIQDEQPPQAQKEKPDWKKRLIYGGNLWFSFGSVRTVDISPMIGYFVKPRLIAGNYFFYNYFEDLYYNFHTDIYGLRPYIQFIAINNINDVLNIDSPVETGIVLQGESEFMSLNSNLFAGSPILIGDAKRIWVNSIFIGGGIRQSAGGKSGMFLLILWNISNPVYYPYGNPVIRFGFNF